MQEIDPMTQELIQEGKENSLQILERDEKTLPKYKKDRLNKVLTYFADSQTTFNYQENGSTLWLNLSIPELNFMCHEPVFLTTYDKINLLKAINKDNNVVRAGLENVIAESKKLENQP